MSGLDASRAQMGVSLAFHIVFASLGVGLPIFLLVAEYLGIRRKDEIWMDLAHRWAKAFSLLFAVGAVSGTVLSFSLGLFWPGLMGRFGSVIGLAFSLEAFAFFLEAIFLGIYLYGWQRLSPWKHWMSGIPVAASGAASAWFVVTVNAWFQTPAGFVLNTSGKVSAVSPWHAMFNRSTPVMTAHMLIAAYMATGLVIASVYAAGMLRGRRDASHRRALALGLTVGLVLAPVQIVVGDMAARLVARTQPVKLAAMESQWITQHGAPLHLGGIPIPSEHRTIFVVEIPKGLSLIAYGDPNATVTGLNSVPPDLQPNTIIVHIAFQLMVVIGFALGGLGIWALVSWLRRRALPDRRGFLRLVLVAGPAAFVAIEAGWMVTELGRQPWLVEGYLKTKDAVTSRGGIGWDLLVTVAIYVALGLTCSLLLLRLARVAREKT
jgi:cytochrome d ubiquinol oxidase subunit I